jgi:hypothetical protein
MDMQYGHRHAAWTSTCCLSMSMSMLRVHVHDLVFFTLQITGINYNNLSLLVEASQIKIPEVVFTRLLQRFMLQSRILFLPQPRGNFILRAM